MNEKYRDLIDNFERNIGGTENISDMYNCVTRLRISVKDKSKINEEAFSKTPNVIGTNWSGEQFQIVIGAEVQNVHDEIAAKYNISDEKSGAGQKVLKIQKRDSQ